MQLEGSEADRKFERIFFTANDGVVGLVALLDSGNDPFPVKIMNMSEGGICISCRKGQPSGLKKGDRLTLREMNGIGSLEEMTEIQMEIRWLFENQFFENIELGCMFLDTPEKIRSRIRNVVETGTLF